MTIIKAVLDFFFLIKSSDFQVFTHSYMRLLPPSLTPCLSSPPIHVRFCTHTHSPIISHTCTPNCSHSVANPPRLSEGWDAKGIPSKSSPCQSVIWSPSIAATMQPQEGKAKRWSHAMEKGVHLNIWANSPCQGKLQIPQPPRKTMCPPQNKPLHRQ